MPLLFLGLDSTFSSYLITSSFAVTHYLNDYFEVRAYAGATEVSIVQAQLLDAKAAKSSIVAEADHLK